MRKPIDEPPMSVLKGMQRSKIHFMRTVGLPTFQPGVPIRNILLYRAQFALTGEICLYNGSRVGELTR